MIAPWRIKAFRDAFPGRTELIAYCEKKNIPVKASTAKPYSSDENVLHISYEAGELEDLTVNGVELVDFGMGVSPQEAPDKSETVTIGFQVRCPDDIERIKVSRAGNGRTSSTTSLAVMVSVASIWSKTDLSV